METKKIIIIGATSGMGYRIARLYQQKGWRVGIAGRRTDKLQELATLAPEQTVWQQIDITQSDAEDRLCALAQQTGGMDVFLLCSGIGSLNRTLKPEIELNTVATNGEGFTRMVTAAYRYFAQHGGGQLAVISSIAGVKGLGSAPAYSATKRFQNIYIDALEQLAYMEKLPIHFTDIRPGFVQTALLKDDKYPLTMDPDYAARKIVKAIDRKKRRTIIDWRYAILVFFWKLIPACIWKRLPIHI
jgi:short-subunit dehydrogenase